MIHNSDKQRYDCAHDMKKTNKKNKQKHKQKNTHTTFRGG